MPRAEKPSKVETFFNTQLLECAALGIPRPLNAVKTTICILRAHSFATGSHTEIFMLPLKQSSGNSWANPPGRGKQEFKGHISKFLN